MSSYILKLFDSFQARLSRNIAFWIFASIVVIEAIILVPSYYKEKRELLNDLEEVSEAVVNSSTRWHQQSMSDQEFTKKLENIISEPVIKGIVIYKPDGQTLVMAGELPSIELSEIKNTKNCQVCRRRLVNNRYDVAWSTRQQGVEKIIVIRHDASAIQPKLNQFIIIISGLVLIISVFVTGTTMIVLGATVIAPILRLRDDLMAVGETLNNNDQQHPNFYAMSVKRRDELGEVLQAFNLMFKRVSWEITERKRAENKVRTEQEQSDRLLLNILPEPIAKQLKEGKNNIADGFTEVTILFADIVGFTNLSEKISPQEVVKLLNEIFTGFDQLSEQHGLEKIKTIGDAYMVASGLPMPRQDHAEAIAEMALDMQQEVASFNTKHQANLSIRIGINTGPVVAGVIGTKKFIYDLWGDAVNTASRMESHGIPGCIQVTESTYKHLQTQYQFKERGKIQVKGKGEMITYLLIQRKVQKLPK
ncbi:MAG: adenylate/guanylate cyclase domain-containing protein [Symploca sp. SIO2G7]|nr:adenylate/guanylate cyclase domain-containing protein [Symploca sp. SIO2G7]